MPGLAERALRIIRERYDFGPTLPVKARRGSWAVSGQTRRYAS